MAAPTRPVKLAPEAHEKLDALQKALQKAGIGGKVEKQDIVSALVFYTTPPQAAFMLQEYWRYSAEQEEEGG